MDKSQINDQIDRLVIELINNHLLRYTIQFFYKTDKGLRPFGSGVLVLTHDTHLILTASHVADYLQEDKNDLFIRVNRKRYISVLGDIVYTDIDKSKGIDLAYIKIDSQMLTPLSKPYKYLTIDKISKHNPRLKEMSYCVIGFPEKNFKRKEGLLETGASFYLTSATDEKPYDYYKLDKENFIIVLMQGKGTDMKSGKSTTVDSRFYGISGCGLWFLTYYLDSNTNKYSIDYRLVGIMTEFKKGKYFCLIANKMHLFIEALQVFEGFQFKVRSAE